MFFTIHLAPNIIIGLTIAIGVKFNAYILHECDSFKCINLYMIDTDGGPIKQYSTL